VTKTRNRSAERLLKRRDGFQPRRVAENAELDALAPPKTARQSNNYGVGSNAQMLKWKHKVKPSEATKGLYKTHDPT